MLIPNNQRVIVASVARIEQFAIECHKTKTKPIDLSTDTVAILNSIVSNSYYGMLRGQISMYLLPEHPIIDI